uniref:NADH-ubiquinone oxidoreductase chain 1 n=1 Tax=Strongyloides cebus TaxID=174719 RepID=A0A977NWP7_9BILA|nr:NADH dehydrogenase subunit 1 [Strongyloides cebus]UWK23994.1 NADH dehydrogenase subunit 1 [Strongyloides cebus]
MFFYFLLVFFIVFFVLQSIAFVTLYERHLLGLSQSRLGPSKVVFCGFFQAFVDGFKLLSKVFIFPFHSSSSFFLFVPFFYFVVMFFEWMVIPFFFDFFSFEFSVLFLFCMVGFSVYFMMFSGIFSKSKYSFIGSLRSSSQSISYEISFCFIFFCFILHFGVFSFVCDFFSFSVFVLFFLFLIMVIGELNRAPFDFSEGESELVSGFNIEYSSIAFVFLFLSEYGVLIFFSVLFSFMFFGGYLFFSFLFFSLLVFIRSSFPRYRYDLMMDFFWKIFLPVSIFLFLFFFLVYF